MKIHVMIDLSNLYYCVRKRHGGHRIDFESYLAYAKSLGDVTRATMYSTQNDGRATLFIEAMQALGFQFKFKEPKTYFAKGKVKMKANWDVGMTIDAMSAMADYDMLILGSADGDFRLLVEYLQLHGKRVFALGCEISRDLRDTAYKAVEIPESFLL